MRRSKGQSSSAWKPPSTLEKLFWPPSAPSPQDNPFVLGPLYPQPRLTRQEAGHAGSGVDELTGARLLVDKGQVGQPVVLGFLVDSHEPQRAAEVPETAGQAGLRTVH